MIGNSSNDWHLLRPLLFKKKKKERKKERKEKKGKGKGKQKEIKKKEHQVLYLLLDIQSKV